jgi:8-oxo-dGTP pyrophosphatase MutT (NUDIX family)
MRVGLGWLQGGLIEASDPSAIDTAVREAEEEIGLPIASWQVLGLHHDTQTMVRGGKTVGEGKEKGTGMMSSIHLIRFQTDSSSSVCESSGDACDCSAQL